MSMYCSREDSIIYGKNIPLYKILYIKKMMKKYDEMIKKQNRKITN
jgi:hypothetical protein